MFSDNLMVLVEIFFFGLVICSLMMTVTWIVAVRMKFFSVVDVTWAYGMEALMLFYVLMAQGVFVKKAVAASMATLWSLRLGTFLALRLKSHYPTEDRRYLALKGKWGPKKFFAFFQLQALSQALFSVPFLLIAQDSNPHFSNAMFFGIVMFCIGIFGESLADKQLSEFKRLPENRHQVCDTGLWRYSRHPNYFFEWIIWCGIATAAISSPYGYLGLVSPIFMYLTLNYLTGVPIAEEQALKSKGDLYRNYMKKTNRFFPGVPS